MLPSVGTADDGGNAPPGPRDGKRVRQALRPEVENIKLYFLLH
jgi:hypothetical protein